MLAFVVRRVLVSVPVLFGILLLSFAMVRMLPGDPVRMMSNPQEIGDAASYEARREELGLNDPIHVQYLAWVRELSQGNLGYSFHRANTSVLDMIGPRVEPTLRLTVTSVLVALCIGVPVGIVAALRQNSVFDYAAATGSMLAISIPTFFLGLIAIYLFGLVWGILPVGGMRTLSDEPSIADSLRHLILPAGILAAVLVGPYVRYTRQSMLDVLSQEYMVTAKAKGVPRTRVVIRHGLRNALTPLTTVIAIQIPSLLAGAVIIETIFSWPGMGRLVFEAIQSREYPLIVAIVLLTAILVMIANLCADILAAILDPRIKL